MHKRTFSCLAVALCVPLVALADAKPQFVIRAVSGVTCAEALVCTDDQGRREEAERWYAEAFSCVGTSIGPLMKRPLAVFCSTESCDPSFGRTDSTARTVGDVCVVISPRGTLLHPVPHGPGVTPSRAPHLERYRW